LPITLTRSFGVRRKKLAGEKTATGFFGPMLCH